MKKKINFKLNCDAVAAAEYIETAEHPLIEKSGIQNGDVELCLMREHSGIRYVEFVFYGKIEDGEVSGEIKSPPGDDDRPGVLKTALLAVMSLCVFAAMFGVVYLFVHIFARSLWLSLYIALPVFAGIVALITVITLFRKRKKRQIDNLKEFLQGIIIEEEKKK